MADKIKNKIKRKLEGVIISDKMDKTRVVAITNWRFHSKYLKYYKMTKKFKAHDEKNEYHIGDRVIIEETRPLSKEKRWKIVGLVQKLESKSEELKVN